MFVEVSRLVECPSCGTEVAVPAQSRPGVYRKQGEEEAKRQSVVGVFECPRCKSKFRSQVETADAPSEMSSAGGLVERINSIREGLAQTLKTLRVKIKTLETERALLLTEVEELKRVAESRANALEIEVSQLREEIKSLREVLEPDINKPL
jgi:vacuolar-type H+-ATPase subunit I/STV1